MQGYKNITINDVLRVSEMLNEQKETVEASAKNALIDLCNELNEEEMAKSVKEKGLPTAILLPHSTPDYFFAGLRAMLSNVSTRVEKVHIMEKISFSWVDLFDIYKPSEITRFPKSYTVHHKS